MDNLFYWLKGGSIQNFGDFLSEYFMERLFLATPRDADRIALIGSILADFLIPDSGNNGEGGSKTAYLGGRKAMLAWGCGVREIGGVSAEKRKATEVLAIRGPLSASEMRLGADVSFGDPGLLLPAIYTPSERMNFVGKAVLVPHFHESRSNNELLELTGADVVLRPNIRPSLKAVEQFIDALYSARFVLSASLHGAIVAAAYGRPFAYWDSGNVDLPFKWRDFSESAKIPTIFVKNLAEGVAHYEQDIAPAIQLPSLWESLARAPFILRPDSLLKVFVHESRSLIHGEAAAALAGQVSVFERQYEHFRKIANESGDVAKKLGAYGRELQCKHDALRAQLASEIAGRDEQIRLVSETASLRERERDEAIQRQQEAEERVGLRERERDEAFQRQQEAEQRVSLCERGRDEAVQRLREAEQRLQELSMFRSEAKFHVSHAINEQREFLRQLDRSARRPWRPFKHYFLYSLLKFLGLVTTKISRRASKRFLRSAQKRDPKRFQTRLEALHDPDFLTNYDEAPTANHGEAPAASYSEAPNTSRDEAPDASCSEAPDASYSEAPAASYGETPDASHGEAPAASYGEAPDASCSEAPDASCSEAPDASCSEAPDTSCSEAPDTRPITPAEPVASSKLELEPSAPDEKRILIIDGAYPTPDHDSGSVDAVNFIKIFHDLGYKVYFIANSSFNTPYFYYRQHHAPKLSLDDMDVMVIDSSYAHSVAEFIKLHGNTFAIFFLSRVNYGGIFYEDIRRHSVSGKIIFNTVDLHHIRERRQGELLGDQQKIDESRHTEECELHLARLADATVVVSQNEAKLLSQKAPGARVYQLPLIREIPGKKAEFAERSGIGFIGGYHHAPNVDAVEYFLDVIWPMVRSQLPGVKFYLMGADMPERLARRNDPDLVVIGYVSDLREAFEGLRLTIAPLRFGAGAKGKVVTSLSYGVPCVCTPIASEGMGLVESGGIVVASTANEFAAAITKLYDDERSWEKASDGGLKAVAQGHSLETGTKLVESILDDISH